MEVPSCTVSFLGVRITANDASLMDPASHRAHCSYLAKLTKGRCFNVRYRLAPQNPFPAQILDAFIAYLSLLSPPPGSFHQPIAARDIVFAGDSAGGNLSLVLLQTLLALRRGGVKTIRFHGKDVPVEVPAGVAGNSPWCDVGRTQPSVHTNAHFDYIDPPDPTKTHPADDIWPAQTPRLDMYANATVIAHPLVSPLAARPEMWKDCPPIYMCLGNEALQNEIESIATKMHVAGVTVIFDGYEGMPHLFSMLFQQSPAGKQCFKSMTEFCMDAVKLKVAKRETGTWMKAFSNPPKFDEISLNQLSPYSDEEVDRMLIEARDKAVKNEATMQQKWREEQMKSKL